MSRLDLGRMGEEMEIAAWAEMMACMPAAVRAALQADCRKVGGALSISAKSIPFATFNRVVGLGLAEPADTAGVAALADHVRGHSAPVVQIQVAPFARPEAIGPLLEKHGFSRSAVRWAKMARSTDDGPLVESVVVVEQVSPATAPEFASTVLTGFGMPPIMAPWLEAVARLPNWRCYIARHAGAAIAGGAMYVGDDAAWLGVTATLPPSRGLRAQGALIARRIADAAALGKRHAFTETGMLDGPNPSLANMMRTGFALSHQRENWVLAA